MKTLLAILVLSMGLQPLPVQPCDMEPATPPAHHAGHGGMADINDADLQPMDCCEGHGTDGVPACPQKLDCSHCPAGVPALAHSHPGSDAPPATLEPVAVTGPVPHRITTPLYRPPIS